VTRGSAAPLLIACALGGCSLAPAYHVPPTAPAPAAYRELGDWKPAAPADATPRGAWWEMFGDPALDALEARVTSSNQDLKAAIARLDEARAATRVARAAYLPTVTAGPSANRYRTSVNSPSYAPGKPPVSDDFVLQADASYEIDLWGRVRSVANAARASERASAADLASLDVSSHAELASDFFLLRVEDAEQALLDRTEADYQRALELTQHLYDGGAVPVGDVREAEAQLQTAKTRAADNRLQRAATEHAIAVLVGESPSTFRLAPSPMPAGAEPPAVSPGLPSELLERRPDVAAAERRAAAANAGIGVARAAYFPVFGLNGGVGYESTQRASWLDAPSWMWSAGTSAVLTLFDGGLHRAQNAAARAAYEEQAANYRATVLRAYQDVEDNLAALRELAAESTSEAAAVTATQGALDQAEYRYRGGIATYLEVVVAEDAALAAQLSAADIERRRFAGTVALIKALGGGWQAPTERDRAQRPAGQ
jgi:NodT family efflux transporter outer membrane factor (OMF) lipoprotein